MANVADEARRASIVWPDGTLRKRAIQSAERNRRNLNNELICLIEAALDAQDLRDSREGAAALGARGA
jgi:hypothetical protein